MSAQSAALIPPLQPPRPSVPRLSGMDVDELDGRFQGEPTAAILAWTWERFGSRAAIGTSFQGAGLVMMHLAKTHGLRFPVFTLDTGLLFPETLDLRGRLEDFFGFPIEALEPDLGVDEQARVEGPELWKRDPDLCCTMRKVLPLRRKLGELDCWITGLRREQAATRAEARIAEVLHDDQAGRDILKLNPMAAWSRDAVWRYIREHRIPYNPLHDRGYQSIGCRPCTRPAAEGGDERAGRWTGFDKVECGIHTFLARRAVREFSA